MNFSYGVIAAVGVLAAISIGLISMSPDEVLQPRMMSDVMDKQPEIPMAELVPEPESTSEPTAVAVVVSLPVGSAISGCEKTNECYIPYKAFVSVGSTVAWSNDDSAAHTVTSGSVASGPNGVFDSGLFMAGSSFEHTFDTVGSFDYFCIVHPWMTGMINVE